MKYRVIVSPKALREIGRLDATVRARVLAALDQLAVDPRPHGYKKLKDRGGLFRIRVGDYRIIYDIHDQTVTVTVLRVGNRGDIYR